MILSLRTRIILSLVALLLISAAAGLIVLYKKDVLLMRSPVLVSPSPVISYMNGEVAVKAPGDDGWMTPEVGQKLKEGSSLKTGPDGEMDIRISSETRLRLDADTVIRLDRTTLKRLGIRVENGRMYGRFHKLYQDQEIEVETSTAVAGVRGTDLVFEVSEKESRIYALSGITEVSNPAFPEERLLLSYQQKTIISRTAPPSQPQNMSPDEVRRFQNELNAIHNDTVFLVTRAIMFKANSAEILPSSEKELERLYNQVDGTRYDLRIVGHTAYVGDAGAQYRLSLERAQAVKDYLVEKGIGKKRLKVAGMGGSRPVADNDSESGRARNRRVEFVIIE